MKLGKLAATILSAVTLFAATANADLLDRYENGYQHVTGHASRGATAAEVQNANKELDWIITDDNQKNLRAFLHWLIQMEKANGYTL